VDEEATVTLWRPIGPDELALVEAGGGTSWPPRLPEQPIFYPVLNEDYATKIARDWNVKAGGVGYVTRFPVRKSFMDRYDVQQVGGRTILEYWMPAEDLHELNANIVGTIEGRRRVPLTAQVFMHAAGVDALSRAHGGIMWVIVVKLIMMRWACRVG
jgi:hypothetical protein